MGFQTGNVAADKFLNLLGDHFAVVPWVKDDGGIEMISLVAENDDSITIKFVDQGEPPFVFTQEVLPSE